MASAVSIKSARGSVYKNKCKKAGFSKSIASYAYNKKGDRYLKMTAIKSGTTRVYESPAAAERDGWYVVQPGK